MVRAQTLDVRSHGYSNGEAPECILPMSTARQLSRYGFQRPAIIEVYLSELFPWRPLTVESRLNIPPKSSAFADCIGIIEDLDAFDVAMLRGRGVDGVIMVAELCSNVFEVVVGLDVEYRAELD